MQFLTFVVLIKFKKKNRNRTYMSRYIISGTGSAGGG